MADPDRYYAARQYTGYFCRNENRVVDRVDVPGGSRDDRGTGRNRISDQSEHEKFIRYGSGFYWNYHSGTVQRGIYAVVKCVRKESMYMVNNANKIEVRHVSKSYGDHKILDDVSFDVYENEFLVILGPGQCGKTVLLNIMAGMEQADSGDITFKDGNSDMGFVFQKYALYNWKTVEKNVELPLKFRGVDRKKRRGVAGRYIDLVGLGGFEHSYPAQLSGGMKQRVGIARAYAMGHSMILMDEPFGALDAQTRYQMEDELLRMRNTEKATIVFVTNNIEEAIYLGDRILLFSDKPSKVVQEYIPGLERPRNNAADDFMSYRTMITGQMDLAL